MGKEVSYGNLDMMSEYGNIFFSFQELLKLDLVWWSLRFCYKSFAQLWSFIEKQESPVELNMVSSPRESAK